MGNFSAKNLPKATPFPKICNSIFKGPRIMNCKNSGNGASIFSKNNKGPFPAANTSKILPILEKYPPIVSNICKIFDDIPLNMLPIISLIFTSSTAEAILVNFDFTASKISATMFPSFEFFISSIIPKNLFFKASNVSDTNLPSFELLISSIRLKNLLFIDS